MAMASLVPTPSLAATRTGSLNPQAFRSNNPPNPPNDGLEPTRAVAAAKGLI